MPTPKDTALYEMVKKEADEKFDKPSAYKSGWLVKTYKERGGTYSGAKPKKGLTRWYKEKCNQTNHYYLCYLQKLLIYNY